VVQILPGTKDLCFLQNAQIETGANPAMCLLGAGGSCIGSEVAGA
jgi:hypothetical protein